jgi:hypothetical protein
MVTTFAPDRRSATQVHRPRLFVVRELAVMSILFVCYRQVRYLTRDHTGAATTNAHRVVGLEQRLGVFTESRVQEIALCSRALIGLLNRYYVTVHFPLTALLVVWVLVRHRAFFSPIRTWLYIVTAAALAIHVAFPLAPPRMLSEHKFVDTLQRYGPRIYSTDTSQSIANQYAAMPSLHFGWAVIVAAGFVAIKRSRASLLAFIHPLVTLIAIVATANHYWLDAAALSDRHHCGCCSPDHRLPARSCGFIGYGRCPRRTPDLSRCLVSIAWHRLVRTHCLHHDASSLHRRCMLIAASPIGLQATITHPPRRWRPAVTRAASGTITNHSTKASFYIIETQFRLDGRVVDHRSTSVDDVEPGETARVETVSSDVVDDGVTCHVTSVDRFKA